MKRLVTLLVALGLMTALSVTFATAKEQEEKAKHSPFVGVWESTDLDGSNQWMWIEYDVGGVYSGRYYDDMATGCFDPWVEGPPALGLGGGFVEGDTMQWSLQYWCLEHPEYGPLRDHGGGTASLTYDESTDTLWDGWVTWYRGKRVKPPEIVG